MTNAQRASIGVVAAVLFIAGAVGLIADLEPGWPDIVLRASILLAAIWFAAPAFSRLPRRVAIATGVVAAVVVVRPRLILFGLAAGAIALILAGRAKS